MSPRSGPAHAAKHKINIPPRIGEKCYCGASRFCAHESDKLRGMSWMLYGANGYTGELAAARAVEMGLKPVLAGRREEAVRPLAERLGLPWRAFPIEQLGDELAGAGSKALLLCAGPFSATSAQAVEACLRARAHY